MSTTRLLTVFGIIGIAVGIAVWTATGNALVGIVIVLVGIVLLALPGLRGTRPGEAGDQPPSTFEGQPPEKFEGEASAAEAKRRKQSEGALNKERAQQQCCRTRRTRRSRTSRTARPPPAPDVTAAPGA